MESPPSSRRRIPTLSPGPPVDTSIFCIRPPFERAHLPHLHHARRTPPKEPSCSVALFPLRLRIVYASFGGPTSAVWSRKPPPRSPPRRPILGLYSRRGHGHHAREPVRKFPNARHSAVRKAAQRPLVATAGPEVPCCTYYMYYYQPSDIDMTYVPQWPASRSTVTRPQSP